MTQKPKTRTLTFRPVGDGDAKQVVLPISIDDDVRALLLKGYDFYYSGTRNSNHQIEIWQPGKGQDRPLLHQEVTGGFGPGNADTICRFIRAARAAMESK